ncbi:hypothetical protein [Clostridium perfringens]|uniref:hypothetical protein n=1 Tax=Clostridium perfringens TaxID=1502 RepID=UPI003CF83BBE
MKNTTNMFNNDVNPLILENTKEVSLICDNLKSSILFKLVKLVILVYLILQLILEIYPYYIL